MQALSRVLSQPAYAAATVSLSLIVLALFIAVPVWSTPGNSLMLQLALMTPLQWLTFSTLAILLALVAVMHIYIVRERITTSARTTAGGAASSIVGGSAGILAGIMASASCSLCILAAFSFIGSGTSLFLVEHRTWGILIAIVLLAASLYFAARKIAHGTCTIRD